MSRNRDIANVLSKSTAIALDSEIGLSLITPTSIAVTGGSGSITSSGAVSFTSASAVSLNDVFSGTYDNYLIIFSCSAVTVDGSINMKLRAAGSDSSAGYYNGYAGLDSGENAVNANLSNSANGFNVMQIDAGSSAKPTFARIEVYRPKLASPTNITLQASFSRTSGVPGAWNGGGVHTPSTPYDAVSFLASAGNISGSITVYGFKV